MYTLINLAELTGEMPNAKLVDLSVSHIMVCDAYDFDSILLSSRSCWNTLTNTLVSCAPPSRNCPSLMTV